MPAATQTLVEDTRRAIGDILHGRDDRLLLVVGPCSIHDHDQALDYARRLKIAADALKDDLLITMRVSKPRTTVGWKGYINDPRLDGSFHQRRAARRAASCSTSTRWACRRRPNSSTCWPQYIARPDRVGRDRRAHDRARAIASSLRA